MAGKTREIILLAGMHRSGTSALARALNLCGAEIPGSLLPPSIHNPRGYWETEEVVEINNRALHSAGLTWSTVCELEGDWYDSLQGRAFLAEARRFADNLKDHEGLLLIKDPRLSLLTSAWRQVFEEAGFVVKLIIAYRDPREVAQSLASRQLIYSPHEAWPPERVYAIWLNYLLSIERLSRGLRRSFVDYGLVLTDWRRELKRICSDLDLQGRLDQDAVEDEIDEFLSKDLKRARVAGSFHEGGIVGETLDLLNEALYQPDDLHARFDAAHEAFAEARKMFNGIVVELQRKNEAFAGMALRSSPRLISSPPSRPAADEADEAIHVRHQALLAAYSELVSSAAREGEEQAARIAQLSAQHAAAEVQMRDEAAAAVLQLETEKAAMEAQLRALEMERDALAGQVAAVQGQAADDLHQAASTAAAALDAERLFHVTRAAVEAGRLREQIVAAQLAGRRIGEERWNEERAALCSEHEAACAALSEQLQEERAALELSCEALAHARVEVSALRRQEVREAEMQAQRQVELAACQERAAGLDEILRSRSWRLTRPLRGLRRQLGQRLV